MRHIVLITALFAVSAYPCEAAAEKSRSAEGRFVQEQVRSREAYATTHVCKGCERDERNGAAQRATSGMRTGSDVSARSLSDAVDMRQLTSAPIEPTLRARSWCEKGKLVGSGLGFCILN